MLANASKKIISRSFIHSLGRAGTLLFCFFPTVAHAHGAEALGPLIIYAALIALIPAFIAALWLKAPIQLRMIFAAGIWIAAGLLIVVGNVMFLSSKAKLRSSEEQKQQMEEVESWQKNALRIAACGHDLPGVRRELENAQVGEDVKRRVFDECAVPQANAEVLEIFLDDLLKRPSTDGKQKHCVYLLDIFENSLNVKLLEAFAERKLTLNCDFGKESMWWLTIKRSPTLPSEQLLLWLHYLQRHEVDLARSNGGESLLTFAFDNLDAQLIQFALDLGIDPYQPSADENSWSPLQIWTLRRFGFRPTGLLRSPTIRLKAQDVAAIQSRLRELTPKEANFQMGNGRRFDSWVQTPDGGDGAALFRYVIQKGARIDLPDNIGMGMINGAMKVTPDFLSALDELTNEQLQLLACPLSSSGDRKHMLYADAKKSGNTELVNFLERRKIKQGCP
jgi:hypothetical protein